ncbi:MAG: nitroreductase family protein [Clostridia bacterium]|nr:nitroreductase family protein [Clostridia bacterium]
METEKVLTERRTIRKFKQDKIKKEDLLKLVDYARLCAFPANVQPLKFAILTDEKMLNDIFPLTKWAGYLQDGAPKEGERPPAYIAVLGDKTVKNTFETEAGAAVTAMMFGAWDKGMASCWLGALKRDSLLELFGLSNEKYELLYLLALGYPAQKSRVCEMTDSVKYFLDENNVLNVPKKSLKDVIIDI